MEEYAQVPSRFLVSERVVGFPEVSYEPVLETSVKDYDAVPGNHPTQWKFDFTKWLVGAVFIDGNQVGGVMVGWFPEAVLWDIRVLPEFQGRGIGRHLVEFAEQWAKSKGAEKLDIETQDNNARACRFYALLGYELVSFESNAYPDLTGEAKLIWSKPLEGR